MTKRVDPTGIPAAIREIAALIGWEAIAAATGKGKRAVQYWGDPESKRSPTMLQAAALDALYLERGGLFAPLRDAFNVFADRRLSPTVADPDMIVAELTCMAREAGEAITAGIQLVGGKPSRAMIHATLIEVSEGSDAFDAVERRLSAMLGEGVA
ncbi:hypothetical protein [Sphingomonas oryzagri]|uniref:XRE family transcriptional regulator n=1 Tax=Sphingomonas oryzagri TaxID=3042314 RepID=A0ABT6N7R6_9SPHN|nr:hypothetical protein [Sphingomonas oryzagri]MDH7641168.1 hypothetical protein [Sphingomonas oryzagri]